MRISRSMGEFFDLVPGERGQRLAEILYRASEISHFENGMRFDSEELGDGNRQYGDMTANSARHIAAKLIETAELEGVHVREAGQIWWLEVEREGLPPVQIYLYKAPPGSRSVWGLAFDSDVKQQLTKDNATQLSLFDDHDGGGGELLNVVAVHYGNPYDGFEGLDMGAPHLCEDGGIGWAWHHAIDGASEDHSAAPSTKPLGDDGAGFPGLSLVDPAPAIEEPSEPGAAEGVVPEFGELQMQEAQQDNSADSEDRR